MANMRSLRVLEAVGYGSAIMIAAVGTLKPAALGFCMVIGLAFAIIVIVRLLVMNASLSMPPSGLGELPDLPQHTGGAESREEETRQ